MGENALSGLFPGGSAPLFSHSEPQFDEKWVHCELIAANLIEGIQPSSESEAKRRAIIDYMESLIRRHFNCQVSTYGSVPLKTYLPDGDIDLSTFSWEPHSSELWASELQSLLKCEEQSKRSKFCVRDAQIINAEVQIVKCLVDDVVVDISFNQLGGICTLCFLEEIDRLVGKDHLFKRSIILVKAWCYYESRILGAHHGLISTYALETLVLYIFNLFHITIRGPFEVLCKFLQFFSQFDWKRYCISLLGPICLTDLHGVNMELPNTDPSTLLFNHDFISTCRHVYGVPFQGTQNLRFKNFSSKNMNIIDPLRLDNNLGRSVNKGNFFRICSALAYGAKQTERILHRSLEDIPEILHDFFRNTKKHCDQCHLDGFTFRIGNMSSQSSSCLPGYSEDKCEMNLSVVESFCEDASKTMNETKNSTSVMGDMTLRCKPEDISGLSSCGAGYHGESTYPSDGIAHQDRYFKSLRESSVSSGCDNKLSEYMESSGESSTLVSGGCGSSCGEADRSVPNEGKYVSMPLLNIQADDHSALHVNNVNGYSILTGDYGAFLLNLHTCRWMVAAQIHKPINFPPYIMYTGQCLLDHYASGGPTNAIFGSMHLVTQAFMQNYEQYLNQPFQALSLQSRSTMLSNRMQQREVYNSYRGTGTYLPTCRPSRYRDLQSMHNGKTRSNSSRLSNWRGIGNQHGSNGFNSRSSHDDMYVNFHSNKQSGYRTRHLYPVEESSNFPTIGVGSEGFNKNPTPRESGSVEGEVTMPREKALQKGSMLTSALPSGSSSSRHGNGFTKEYTEFGSFFIPNYARKTEREVAYDDLRRYPEGLRFQNSLYSMSRNNIDTEVDAKITHNNQGSLNRHYELKEDDFPPLSSGSQPKKSITSKRNTVASWPDLQACVTNISACTSSDIPENVDN